MATVYRCDKCDRMTTVKMYRVVVEQPGLPREFDLCRICQAELVKWIKASKKDND